MRGTRKFASLAILALLLYSGCRQPPGPTQKVPEAYGGTLELTNPNLNHRLDHYVRVLPDSAGLLSIMEVTSEPLQATFQDVMTFDGAQQTDAWYWGKFTVVNRLTETDRSAEWVLYFSTSWTALEVYTNTGDSGWTLERDGYFLPNREKNFAPSERGNLIKLSLPPGNVRTIYFRGKGERRADPPSFDLRLQTTELFYAKLDKARVGNAVFIGLLGMMLLYNLIVYFFVWDGSYLYYSGYLLMMIVYAAYSNDDLEKWLGAYVFVDHPQYFAHFKLSIFIGLSCYVVDV